MADNPVRVGKISSINRANRTARVIFPGLDNMVSDWLPVLWYPGFENTSTGSHGHDVIMDSESYGTNEAGDPLHKHSVTLGSRKYTSVDAGYHTHEINQWMPRVNDRVVVLMESGFNAGGYILGVIP